MGPLDVRTFCLKADCGEPIYSLNKPRALTVVWTRFVRECFRMGEGLTKTDRRQGLAGRGAESFPQVKPHQAEVMSCFSSAIPRDEGGDGSSKVTTISLKRESWNGKPRVFLGSATVP